MKKILVFIIFTIVVGNTNSVSAQENSLKKEIKPALLVIDIQNAYRDMMDQTAIDLPIDIIKASIWLFQEEKLPIIYVYHQSLEWGPEPESKEFQFFEEILVPEDATKVIKHYGNAFNKTDLDKILKELGCNTLFLSGLSATGCVMATTVGANDLDYNTFWIENATMSPNAEQTKMMEDIFESISFQTMLLMLPNLK
jgi:nicotinamidase-related amidase